MNGDGKVRVREHCVCGGGIEFGVFCSPGLRFRTSQQQQDRLPLPLLLTPTPLDC